MFITYIFQHMYRYLNYKVIVVVLVIIIILFTCKCMVTTESFQLNENIPKIIYMCCEDKQNVPQKVFTNWLNLNPEYTIELYDDYECYEYLVSEFGQEYGDFYTEIPFGPIRADFWRVCILYKKGGVYSDIDLEPLQPLDKIISDENITFCSILSTYKNNIFQAFIYTTKGNIILKKCIEYMFRKRELIKNTAKTNNIYSSRGNFYWNISGTHDMYKTLKEIISTNNLTPNIYYTTDQKIKILDEYTPPGKSTKSCKVRYNGSVDLFNSRYSDYKMYEHSF